MHEPADPRNIISASSRVSRLAFAALIAGNVALASGGWLVRLADTQSQVGPIAAGFWRLALAVPILLLLTRFTGQPIGRPTRGLWLILALGGLLFAADLASWHIGILHTTLTNATLFGNSTSLMFPLYGFLIARAWPSRSQGAALLLAAFGAILLLGRSYELSPENLMGDLLCLLAGFFYTLYLIAIDRARTALSAWPLLAISTLAGMLPLLALAAAAGEQVWPLDWGPLIMLALVSQVIGQGLLIFAMGHFSPLVIGVALLSQPIVAAAIGWAAYRELLALPDVVGAVAICAAIVMVQRTSDRSQTGEVARPPQIGTSDS